jgi:transposase InsO family protein
VVAVEKKLDAVRMHREGVPVQDICKELGVSRRSVFYWSNAFDGTIESLEPGSRAPKRPRRKITKEIEERIIELRTSKKWGYRRIKWRIKREFDTLLSHHAVKMCLRKHGLAGYRKRRRKKSRKRRTRTVPNQRWEIDIKECRIAGGARICIFTAVDDRSRRMFAKAYGRKTTDNAIDFVDCLVGEVGKMKAIKVDNGKQFVYITPTKYRGRRIRKRKRRRMNRFGKHVKSIGIKLKFIDFGCPNQNAKVERGIRTLKEEFLLEEHLRSVGDANRKLSVWRSYYNMEREHGSLEGRTPMEVWEGFMVCVPIRSRSAKCR